MFTCQVIQISCFIVYNNRRLEDRQPVPGPWQQGAVTNLLKCLEEGRTPDGSPQSKESDGLCTTLPLIAR